MGTKAPTIQKSSAFYDYIKDFKFREKLDHPMFG